MKFKALAVLMLLSTTALAATPSKPQKCPDIGDLKNARFTVAKAVEESNLWIVSQADDRYGTKQKWHFVVNIEALDESDALKKAEIALSTMKLVEGPAAVEKDWMCYYRNGQHDATAVTSTTPVLVKRDKKERQDV